MAPPEITDLPTAVTAAETVGEPKNSPRSISVATVTYSCNRTDTKERTGVPSVRNRVNRCPASVSTHRNAKPPMAKISTGGACVSDRLSSSATMRSVWTRTSSPVS